MQYKNALAFTSAFLYLFSFAEVFFVYAAEGASEIFRKILKFRAGSDAHIGCACFFVIFPAAYFAYVFHN